MTWVRLADDFADHPKIAEAGPLAGWLWVCGLAYANKHLTDGYLPNAAVRRLADLDDAFRLAARLVAVGLWEPADGGYRIHDFGDFQPSAAAVRAERERNAERARTWRERQREAGSTGARAGDRNGASAAAPDPAVNPAVNPVPAGTSSPLPPPPQAEEGERLTKITKDDRRLWKRATSQLRAEMKAENWTLLIEPLEPLGRTPEGALVVRAQPGYGIASRVEHVVRKALLDAGDAAAKLATVVEA